LRFYPWNGMIFSIFYSLGIYTSDMSSKEYISKI
jgi:hypothetical protein